MLKQSTKAARRRAAAKRAVKRTSLAAAAPRVNGRTRDGSAPRKTTKRVYFFGAGKAEGRAEMKLLLGGKGANLADMTLAGLPVPPGFTITTETCKEYYDHGGRLPEGLMDEVREHLSRVEKLTGKNFGDPDNPLLVSVRSGAAVSMPGMMDTVLNLGLNDAVTQGLARLTNNDRFAYDSYRRLINMFGDVVMGIGHEEFEHELSEVKRFKGVANDTDLSADDLKEVVRRYKELYREHLRADWPQDPMKQLEQAIEAVFKSWNTERAERYRQIHEIRGLAGTAVNVQTMVFGNMGDDCATGVAFTRNPSTGENKFYGEFLINAQGEDVVAGIRTPIPCDEMPKYLPQSWKELLRIKDLLEKRYREVQDFEFTIERKKLYMLQTRTGKRTAQAAVRIAVEMVKEKLIDEKTAVLRVDPASLDQLLHPTFDPGANRNVLAKGLPASPGAAVGRIAFTAQEAEDRVHAGEKIILVRRETEPADIGGMHVSEGILTSTGGMTSHAAVVARGMGTPCVAGVGALDIDAKHRTLSVNGRTFGPDAWISLDGSTGEVMEGQVPTVEPSLTGPFKTIMQWADKYRVLKVRTNADTPTDARVAREFGAEGIGLCRTEHMFFDPTRIQAVREMILAADQDGRRRALAKLLPYQRGDFVEIFREMRGLPVTIRLLDPPLHEFLPHSDKDLAELARALNVTEHQIRARVTQLHELNPMLGHRGCRLAVTFPEILEMQVQAVIEAAIECKRQRIAVLPEIMIPLVGSVRELIYLKKHLVETAERIMSDAKVQVEYLVGTMIEVPRAAVTADEIAAEAEFFSFGTNDLTQMALGFSRDDVNAFLPDYLRKEIYERDPFQTIDRDGVGTLMRMGVEKGQRTRPDIKLGICGEHGGDPRSVEFCHELGLNYVSCSPFRVPIARLAAAHAAIKDGATGRGGKSRKK
jgi:pyruvate,orthophosphate dikinase